MRPSMSHFSPLLTPRRGRPPRKGARLGSPTTLARKRQGWQDHPREAGAKVQSWIALWPSVLPGRPIRVVVVKRKAAAKTKRKGSRALKAPVEAFFTTDLTLSVDDVLASYGDRWAVEIDIRDGQAYYDLGQDQCRKRRRIIGANTFRLLMAAARTLWFMERTAYMRTLDLRRYRPWYRKKVAPSQLDLMFKGLRVDLGDGSVQAVPDFMVSRLSRSGPRMHSRGSGAG